MAINSAESMPSRVDSDDVERECNEKLVQRRTAEKLAKNFPAKICKEPSVARESNGKCNIEIPLSFGSKYNTTQERGNGFVASRQLLAKETVERSKKKRSQSSNAEIVVSNRSKLNEVVDRFSEEEIVNAAELLLGQVERGIDVSDMAFGLIQIKMGESS